MPWLIVFDVEHWRGREPELRHFIRDLGRRGRPAVVLAVTPPRVHEELRVGGRPPIAVLTHEISMEDAHDLGQHLNRFLDPYGRAKSDAEWQNFWETPPPLHRHRYRGVLDRAGVLAEATPRPRRVDPELALPPVQRGATSGRWGLDEGQPRIVRRPPQTASGNCRPEHREDAAAGGIDVLATGRSTPLFCAARRCADQSARSCLGEGIIFIDSAVGAWPTTFSAVT